MEIRRIFVACGFTWNNKGDAALLISTAQALRKWRADVSLSFSSFTPELDSDRYGEKVVRMPVDPSGKFSQLLHRVGEPSPWLLRFVVGGLLGMFRLWLALRVILPREFAFKLLNRAEPIARQILDADVVVALPGGYLQATEWRDDYWLFHWLVLNMAKAAGKPVVVYAQSIGPFTGAHLGWAKSLLRKIDAISVREEFSRERLLEYGIPAERIELVPDAAFGLDDDGRGAAEVATLRGKHSTMPRPWLGVSVREHNFPGKADTAAWMEGYLREVAQAADRFVAKTGGSVFFVPQCIRSGGRDIEVSRDTLRLMESREHATVIEDDLSPLGLKALYGEFDIFIGTRMHANILAMCAGTPVAAIAYERKTNGIMKMLGLSQNVINIDEVQGKLLPLVDAVLAGRDEVKAQLANAIPAIHGSALQTPAKLLDRLEARA